MKKTPIYLGIFAKDPKNSSEILLQHTKQSLTSLIQESATYQQNYPVLYKQLTQDVASFQKIFQEPKDNFHITTLFIGGGKNPNLAPDVTKQLQNFKTHQNIDMVIDFLVYVPGYLICGYCSDTCKVEVANRFPHVTLYLSAGAKAVESNQVLEALHKGNPQLFEEGKQKKDEIGVKTGVYILGEGFSGNNSNGNKFAEVFVIAKSIKIQAVTGNNFTHGKK